MKTFIIKIKQQWFSISLILLLIVAYLIQHQWQPQTNNLDWIKTLSIVTIFFVNGLSLKLANLLVASKQWRSHIYIQSFCYIVFPLVVFIFSVLFSDLDQLVTQGFILLAALPSTIASSISMTVISHGHKETAIFNSTLSNLLGIIVTPFIIYLILSSYVEIDALEVIKKICLLVILPLIAGFVAQHIFPKLLTLFNLGLANQWILLVMLFIIFLQSFGLSNVDLNLLWIVVLCFVLKVAISIANYRLFLCDFFKVDAPFRKVIYYCGTQKTLALGLPIAGLLFPQPEMLAVALAPIITYHLVQLIIDGVVAVRWQE